MNDSRNWQRWRRAALIVLTGLGSLPTPSHGQTASEVESWHADPTLVARLTRERPEFLYDEQRVPRYDLPPLFNRAPANLREWEVRRLEILDLLQHHLFGQMPASPERIEAKTVSSEPLQSLPGGIRKRIEVTCHLKGGKLFRFGYWLYAVEGECRPVFVMINNREPELANPAGENFDEFTSIPMLLESGVALAVFQHNDLAPDNASNYRNGLLQHVLPAGDRAPDAPGAIAAWAWGASRVLDSLADEPLVDSSRAAVIGHSRGGKTALFAGAMDARFSLAISNESGCAGAALSRRKYGETLGRITSAFDYWFCPRAAEYADRENEMPIDQHHLVAAICPRHVYVASAADDLWADPRGEWLGLVNAAPAFEAEGVACLNSSDSMPPLDTPIHRGPTSYHVRSGGHDLLKSDWKHFIPAAQRSWAK